MSLSRSGIRPVSCFISLILWMVMLAGLCPGLSVAEGVVPYASGVAGGDAQTGDVGLAVAEGVAPERSLDAEMPVSQLEPVVMLVSQLKPVVTPAVRLAPVVVTATRGAVMAEQVMAPVTVIDRARIESSPARTLPDLLASEGGLSVTTSGGQGKVSSVFMRGTNSGHVLVLIDGVRLQSATLGTPALEHIPLGQIERIEIVRGGRSGLYGADAVGGVIQIFTRRGGAEGPQGQVALDWGSDRTRAVTASVGGAKGRGALNLRVTHEETAGFDVSTLPATHPDRDGYRNRSLGLAWDYSLAARTRLALNALAISSESEIDSPWNAVPTPDDIETAAQYLLAMTLDHALSPAWEARMTTRFSVEDYIGASSGVRQSHFRTERQGIDWIGRYTGRADQEWVLGLDVGRESVGGESVTTFLHRERVSRAIFGQWLADWDAFSTQAVVRYDTPDRGGSVWTGNLEAVMPLASGWEFALGLNRAFKQPTMNDLYYVDAWGSSGNPALRPETAHGVEARLEVTRARWSGRLGVFAQRIDELIVWVEQPPGSWSYTPVNVAQAEVRGVELAWHYQFPLARLEVNGTLLRAEDSETGLPLPRRAESEWRARLAGPLALGDVVPRPVEGVLEVSYVGTRYEDAAALNRLAGYPLWNAGLRYVLGSQWHLALDVRNVFDQQAMAVLNYPIEGRNWRLGIRLEY